MRGANSIIEGRECGRPRPLEVVLGTNCVDLPSDTDENPTQFGHQRE